MNPVGAPSVNGAPNMNGFYHLSETPRSDTSKFPKQYSDYPGGAEYFDVYSPPTESIVKLNQQMQRVTAASPALPSRLPVRSSPVADTTESVDFSRTFMTFRIDSLKKEVLTSGHSRRGDEERLFSACSRSRLPPSAA